MPCECRLPDYADCFLSPRLGGHDPVPHHEIVQALVETLGFCHIGVVHDEYAVSPDGMKAFGVLDLATEMEGCRFSIGLRNSHDKSMRLAMTCGYRVFVCSNMAFAELHAGDDVSKFVTFYTGVTPEMGFDFRFRDDH